MSWDDIPQRSVRIKGASLSPVTLRIAPIRNGRVQLWLKLGLDVQRRLHWTVGDRLRMQVGRGDDLGQVRFLLLDPNTHGTTRGPALRMVGNHTTTAVAAFDIPADWPQERTAPLAVQHRVLDLGMASRPWLEATLPWFHASEQPAATRPPSIAAAPPDTRQLAPGEAEAARVHRELRKGRKVADIARDLGIPAGLVSSYREEMMRETAA